MEAPGPAPREEAPPMEAPAPRAASWLESQPG